jgi:hypothetical protein
MTKLLDLSPEPLERARGDFFLRTHPGPPSPLERDDDSTTLTGRRMTMRYVLALGALAAMAAGVMSATAATPKPHQWTTAQAAAAIRAYGDELAAPRDLVSVTCRGIGKPAARRFVTFRCRVTLEDGRLLLNAKTRRAGGLCFATGVVPSGCLAPGKRAKGSLTEVARAVYAKYGAPAQTFTATAHGSGFYSWTWVSGAETHRGTVKFAPQPVVKIQS